MTIRVLIVDDSPLVRAVLREVLSSDPEIAVAGEAADGYAAVRVAKELRPDVVTMDVLMPMMDGLDAMKRILDQCATRVIVLANTDGTNGALAMRALESGAMEVFAKPRGGFTESTVRDLLATIKRVAATHAPTPGPRLLTPRRIRPLGPVRASVVGLVGSTGAPHIMHEILAALPSDFPWPIAIVQHTAPGFTQALADWLAVGCRLRVRVAKDGELLAPGDVVLAPDERHLAIDVSRRVRILHEPRVDGHCPSATVLLRSIAQSFRSTALGIVLTGMGRDGAEGAGAVEEAGGLMVIEDPATAALAGMPEEALRRTQHAVVERANGLPSLLLHLWRGPS